ncbi:MAG: hypothetical protein LBU09_03225 [Endomicrobium sp.]|jgi:hypothetical protein|nr:hypothetical protein [Endomicrobium sp.]
MSLKLKNKVSFMSTSGIWKLIRSVDDLLLLERRRRCGDEYMLIDNVIKSEPAGYVNCYFLPDINAEIEYNKMLREKDKKREINLEYEKQFFMRCAGKKLFVRENKLLNFRCFFDEFIKLSAEKKAKCLCYQKSIIAIICEVNNHSVGGDYQC